MHEEHAELPPETNCDVLCIILQVCGEKGSLPVTPQTMAKLRRHVHAIVSGLPEDLQQVLASSR